MCYALYMSTDSPEELTVLNSEFVRFERIDDPEADPCITLLTFPHRWYVGSKSGCSCTFRHLNAIELGFGAPEDWYPEEQDALGATKELYRFFSRLLSTGHQVDCVDRWQGAKPDAIRAIDVSLDEVSVESFRLFENHRFRLCMNSE